MKAMAKRAKAVTDMEIDEISLVDRPANQHALVTIAKRANEEDAVPEEFFDETGEEVDVDELEDGDVVFDAEGQAYEFEADTEDAEADEADDGVLEEVGKAFRLRNPVRLKSGTRLGGNAPAPRRRVAGGGGTHSNGFQGGQLGGIHPGGRVQPGQPRTGMSRRRKALIGGGIGAAAGGGAVLAHRKMSKSFADEVREELSKAIGEDDRDAVISKALGRLAEYETEIAEAQEIAKSERDLRLTREYISKAAEYNVPVEPDELGPVLMHMAEALTYEDCAVIHKALSAAGQMLFDELGFQGEADNADPFSMIEEELDARVAKGGNTVSKAEQITEFFDNDPRAYDEYRANLGR